MRFNQFSYIPTSEETILTEFQDLGFSISKEVSDKKNVENFVRKLFFLTEDTDQALANLIATWDCDALSFFRSDQALTEEIFYHLAFQLLGFVPHFDYQDVSVFRTQTNFPISYGNIFENLYQLLNTRTKNGNTLIDILVSDGLIPADNQYHYFNGKSLATFSSADFQREVVYVETPVDTAHSGQTDLVKVSIIRPTYTGEIPAIITNSPYHQGVNEVASDQALHKMETPLEKKEPATIVLKTPSIRTLPLDDRALPISQAREKLGHISSYSLNDYLLSRGVANIHVSGVGTLGSTGYMTSGDYQQVLAYKAVIDWLNGRARAYTSHERKEMVLADWCNGRVATSGLSYLGTMSNALATTGVEGLEVVIAEAGISSWYDYYRENGLVTSPGGYPGEDLDSLTALTYSKNLQAGDFLRNNAHYLKNVAAEQQALERSTGNYNHYWHERNYLLKAQHVKCEVVFTHGSQDWNVKPIHVWNMFHALPDTVQKHLFFHNGAHVYMNNWQSIDFRESMNALLSQKLLGLANHYTLPEVIWQENSQEQSWTSLSEFGGTKHEIFSLGKEKKSISQEYPVEEFTRYCSSYKAFHKDLYADKAHQITVDIPIEKDFQINGRILLQLRVRSNVDKGFLSAQLLDFGQKKRLTPIPSLKARNSVDNGRFYAIENLMELPFAETPSRVITKGHMNLQHRTHLLDIQEITPNEWMEITWDLQPTIYRLEKGDTLRCILYTTDFEITIRDNSDWQIEVDLEQSQIVLPTS